MNRRHFAIGVATGFTTIPVLRASATDVEAAECPIMPMFRLMPNRPGPDGLDFPVTTGMNHWLQRQVWPENPDMYWDPVGEDYREIFGFHHQAKAFSATQGDVEVWDLNPEFFAPDSVINNLSDHGWERVDNQWPLFRYRASAEERRSFADSLNMLGPDITTGRWDWIAFPDDSSMVLGVDQELVSIVAERVATYPAITTIDSNFHKLRTVLPWNAYIAAVQPAQTLSVRGAVSTFISKSWTGDTPIISSVGVCLDSPDDVDPFVESVRDRLKSETSALLNMPYSEFIEIGDIQIEYASVRIDFIPNTLDWDIFLAVQGKDFGMLPPA